MTDLVEMLMETLDTKHVGLIVESCKLITNLSTSNLGLNRCSPLLVPLVDLAEFYLEQSQTIPLEAIFPVLSNLLYNPSYDEKHNEKFKKLFCTIFKLFDEPVVQSLFDNYVLKLAVNIRYRSRIQKFRCRN